MRLGELAPKLRGVEAGHVRNKFIPFLLSGNFEEAKVIAHQVLSLLGVPEIKISLISLLEECI
jgi:hypothetical protein